LFIQGGDGSALFESVGIGTFCLFDEIEEDNCEDGYEFATITH
jgi:hypothetical protein